MAHGPFSPDLLAGRTALVTGGGTGIGKAIALQLGACGARVAIAGRRSGPLEETRAELEAVGVEAIAVPTDIREPEQVEEMIATVAQTLGRIGILVNNAGGQFAAPSREISVRGVRAVSRLNFEATWDVTRAVAVDSMIDRGGGRILNLTLAIQRGLPGLMPGVATRAAVHSMTRQLGTEWARHGIGIVSLAAGHVLTEGLRGYPAEVIEHLEATVPVGRLGRPEEVAAAAAFLVSPYADYITGTVVEIDGGKSNWGDTYMIDKELT
ncbi:MAG: SDR family oxidoreductase [Actinobacteria bacterium]|nr:SDR family oxidoreductase [Actinomycetota bacterium]